LTSQNWAAQPSACEHDEQMPNEPVGCSGTKPPLVWVPSRNGGGDTGRSAAQPLQPGGAGDLIDGQQARELSSLLLVGQCGKFGVQLLRRLLPSGRDEALERLELGNSTFAATRRAVARSSSTLARAAHRRHRSLTLLLMASTADNWLFNIKRGEGVDDTTFSLT